MSQHSLLLILLLFSLSCRQQVRKEDRQGSETKARKQEISNTGDAAVPAVKMPDRVVTGSLETDTILGAWIRPDGNYVLEITGVNDNNSLDANYYNPNPINISMAQVKKEDKLKIYVEFDDVNYRGSYYDLQYDAANDALVGNYYQATYGQTYPIAFIRYDQLSQ